MDNHPKHCDHCGGQMQEVLHLTIKGPWLRALDYIATKEEMDVVDVMFWLMKEGMDNSIMYDIDVPGDTFLGTNIEIEETLRQDKLDTAKWLLNDFPKDCETIQFTDDCEREFTLTKQELVDGIARLEKLLAE